MGRQLAYALAEFGLTMPFRPTDFTQVNPHINRVLVGRALRLLDVRPHERVIDWFCGLGNFTLPIATRAREVLGIEGSEALVARARDNAAANEASHPGLAARATLRRVQPVRDHAPSSWPAIGAADKWLVDPPREGAFALVKALAELHAGRSERPAGDRRGASSTSAAIRPRWRAMPACSCTRPATAAGRGRGQHVPAHRACGEPGGLRPPGFGLGPFREAK